MSERLIKCRKGKDCDGCNGFIKYGEKYKKCIDLVDNETLEISFCMNCHEKHILSQTECKKGNHERIEKVNTVWENGVPYPEYTDEYVCENCGIDLIELEKKLK